jgi:DNA-binding XRE family transcriptional regulator
MVKEFETRLAGAAYVDAIATLVVKFADGRVHAVALTDLEGADDTPVERVSLSSDGYAVLLEQCSGNRLEVPWDVVLHHAEPNHAFYRGRYRGTEADDDSEEGGLRRAEAIGERVRRERAKRMWTLADMSVLTGIKVPNLSRLEKGRHLPSLETLERVADALGLPVAALVAVRHEAGVPR